MSVARAAVNDRPPVQPTAAVVASRDRSTMLTGRFVPAEQRAALRAELRVGFEVELRTGFAVELVVGRAAEFAAKADRHRHADDLVAGRIDDLAVSRTDGRVVNRSTDLREASRSDRPDTAVDTAAADQEAQKEENHTGRRSASDRRRGSLEDREIDVRERNPRRDQEVDQEKDRAKGRAIDRDTDPKTGRERDRETVRETARETDREEGHQEDLHVDPATGPKSIVIERETN